MSQWRYMLDTDIVSDLVRNPSGKVARKIADIGDDGLCISIIVAAELRYGCAKRGSAALSRQVEAVLSALDIMPLDVPADADYGEVRNRLARAGAMIGPNDLLIAAHAIALRLPLVTGNVSEFSRVHGLAVENWLT